MTGQGLQVEVLNLQEIEVDIARITEVARRTAEGEGAVGELSVVLVDEGRMSELNSQFRQECGPTDVLSFSIDGLISGGWDDPSAEPFVIGEVIVCPEVAMRQAVDSLTSEIDLLVAHGVLHLLGHEHDSTDGAQAMRAKEFAITGRSGARSE